jgi:hypothetical protein
MRNRLGDCTNTTSFSLMRVFIANFIDQDMNFVLASARDRSEKPEVCLVCAWPDPDAYRDG